MIKFEKPEVWGWEHAIRGMRNPLNSWERSDSYPAVDCGKCGIIDREGICHPKEHDCTPYECYAIGDNSLYKRQSEYGRMMDMLGSYTVAGKNKHDDVPDGMAMLAEFAQSLSGARVEVFQRPW